MTDTEILATYDYPEKVWAIRKIEDHKVVAHGYWEAAVSVFDDLYKSTGEYYLDLLKRAPDEGSLT